MPISRVRRIRGAATLLAGAVAAMALAACNSSGGGGFLRASGGQTVDASEFARSDYCPPVVIRADTEALQQYDRGHDGEADFLRYQASMSKTARECHLNGEQLSIKLGVSGRVVAGPKGGAGRVTLPIRVAVVKQTGGTGPLFSQLYKAAVDLTVPDLNTNYRQVFSDIVVHVGPQDRNLIIYVGFDEGKKS
jgi:hypothetical protein